jgi:hypothetical protein
VKLRAFNCRRFLRVDLCCSVLRVASHPFAQNAKGWGTLFRGGSRDEGLSWKGWARKNHQTMTRRRMFTLLVVVAHWMVAVGHLFLAAKVLPAPNNSVSWLAITMITFGHLAVSIGLWKLSDKPAGLVSLIFFLAAMSADLYEHFLHASANNVFMVTPGDWTAGFDASVFVLLALEIVGCLLGVLLLGGRTRNDRQPQFAR